MSVAEEGSRAAEQKETEMSGMKVNQIDKLFLKLTLEVPLVWEELTEQYLSNELRKIPLCLCVQVAKVMQALNMEWCFVSFPLHSESLKNRIKFSVCFFLLLLFFSPSNHECCTEEIEFKPIFSSRAKIF